MFKLQPNPTFCSVAHLTVPGVPTPGELTVTWRHKGRQALAEWLQAMPAQPVVTVMGAATTGAGQVVHEGAKWLAQVMDAWDGPVNPDGEAVPLSVDALVKLLDDYPAAGGELMQAYLTALTESRAKN
jgi:hypothetical protein